MNDDEITSEHTCGRVGQVLEEVEALRLEMGRNMDPRRPMLVRNASPREVFYHAQTLHRKANQLCIELGADSLAPPISASPAQARPADVLRVLDSTRERLSEARARLHIEGDTARPELPGPLRRASGKGASDVLAACLVAGRQMNGMLARACTSREGHERLLAALGIAQCLLALLGAELPPPPPLERGKFPREVFQVLWQAWEALHEVLVDSGVKALELREGFAGEEPSDVYDLASLILSELEYVGSLLPSMAPPAQESRAPSPTLPAHNYRLARQLQAAIGLLAGGVRARPDWIRALAG